MNALLRNSIWVGIAASAETALILTFINAFAWSKVIVAGAITTLAYRYIQNTFQNNIIDKCLLIIVLLFVPMMHWYSLLWWLPLIAIVLVYKNKFLGMNLRKVGALKSTVVSICWLMMIGSLVGYSQIIDRKFLLIGSAEFSLFMSLTAVNDMFMEEGEKCPWKSPWIIRIWSALFALLSAALFIQSEDFPQIGIRSAAILPLAFLILLQSKPYPRTSTLLYFVDGTIILRAVIALVSVG